MRSASASDRTLSHEDARRFYDRFGSKQDWQRFYEDPAVEALTASAAFADASAVVEFGCGTGRLAARLLRERLRKDATYLAVDLSATMVALTRARLAPFGARVRVLHSDGSPTLREPNEACDRFVSTYVLDLLAEHDIRRLLEDAHRLLRADGMLGLVSLTHGATTFARLVERAWVWTHHRRPSLVGGCRPISLLEFITRDWDVVRHAVLTSYAMSSEVVVARKVG